MLVEQGCFFSLQSFRSASDENMSERAKSSLFVNWNLALRPTCMATTKDAGSSSDISSNVTSCSTPLSSMAKSFAERP
jgi:hypothetical protein